jgi:hypothetical protein
MAEWKKVVVSGSSTELNSLFVTSGVTGSLLGTASLASTSSLSITSSNTILQNNILSNQTVGGLVSGTSLPSGSSIESILRTILITYIPPTLS